MTNALRSLLAAPASLALAGALLSACGEPSGGAGCPDGCLTPPAATCTGDTLTRYGFLGECVEGQCVYPVASTETCADGCDAGACVVVTSPCDDVTCDTPPDPSCDGEVRVVSGAAGECDADTGTCGYPEVRTDCVERGQVCRSGSCVTPGLCDDIRCDEAPAPRCDGRTAITATAPGSCDEATGQCRFEEQRVNCASRDQTCADGVCVDRPPCEGLNCDTAPAPRCDGSVAVVSSNGRCEESTDTCAWDEDLTDCFELELACVDGACVASTDCDGVVCDTPPAPSCDGDVVLAPGAGGRCDPTTGACRWPTIPRDCAELDLTCADGECVDGLCAGVACTVPPSPRCEGDVAVSGLAPGVCARGRCSYDPVRVDCTEADQICVGGACVDPPICDTLVCDAPPPPSCDGDVATTHAELGSCSDGACSYAATPVDCDARGQGCRDGACFDRCEGVDCLETPPAYCVGDELRAPVGSGICAAGLCSFSEVTVQCGATGQRCIDGGCRTACYGVVCDAPPAPTCEGDSVLTYAEAGTCSDATGGCRYSPTVTNCALTGEVCIAGACVPDPCLTAVCDSPGAPYCAGDSLRTPQGPGVCFDRACQYFESTTDCAVAEPGGRCVDGACRDRCFGIVCSLPPAAYCEDDTAVQFGETGACDPASGSCGYVPDYVNCALTDEVCRAGRCVPPPCRGVTCDEAPAPVCSGDVLSAFIAPGACDEGLCDYPTVERDCAADGLRCADGACRDRCWGVSCDDAPAARCSGDVLLEYADAGTCDPGDGLCDYTTLPRNCRAEGLECRAGACVEPLCTGVTCEAPPAPYCEGDLLVTSYGDGTCDPLDGLCDYASRLEDCSLDGGRCGDGRCITPCEDLACAEAPAPAPVCSGDIAVTYAVTGLCDPFTVECILSTTTRNCVAEGLACREGACVEPPCTGVTCESPPVAYCTSNFLRTPFGVGQCDPDDGTCDYAERVQDCSLDNGRCDEGRCIGPCDGVTCDDRPEAFCGGSIAFTFPDDGTCQSPSGTCAYSAVAVNCFLDGLVCRSGACMPPPCTGVTCDSPPAPYCAGAVAVAAYGTGACDNETGDCGYLTNTEDCSLDGGRCEDGACVAFCDGVVCDDLPESVCAGDVALRYEAPGVCSDFLLECVYTAELTNCTSLGRVCRSGACVEPPCTGVTCDAPAAPFCDDDVLVREFGVGFCDPEDGVCGYASTREDCAADGGACRDGACLEACDLLVCDDFPDDACEGDTALVYDSAQCNNFVGACEYPATAVNCGPLGLVCRDGACVEPPCSGVTCEVPTAPFCEGDVLVTSSLPGTCEPDTGVCRFLTSREDCAADGGSCRDGRCLEFCDLLVCDDVPPDTCIDDIAFDYTAGECDPIARGCVYPVTPVNCAVDGDICVAGQCVPSPCEGVSCAELPAPFCDGTVRVEPYGVGACDRHTGVCEFGELTDDCSLDFGDCVEGACRDFCDIEVCDEVPADTCEGDVAFAYSIGVCDPLNYRCDYVPQMTNCAAADLVCRGGTCAPSLCEGVVCDEPRPAYCAGDTAVAEFGVGTCSEADGACQYTAITEDCTLDGGICRDGTCLDPCDYLVCDAPPSNRCEGNVVFDFSASGECNPLLGGCEYLPAFENCADSGQVCRDAVCVEPLCDGVVCNAAPAPFCDGNTLVAAPAGGVCDEEDGTCDYIVSRLDCATIDATCRNGRCEDRCVGVACNAPPADYCEGDIARRYSASGECTLPGGTCTYVPTSQNCALGGQICRNGACAPDPCAGVDCSTPPAPACEGDTSIQSLAGATCSRITGRCAWDTIEVDCAAFGGVCVDGLCASPCAVVVCDDPPPPVCLGSVAVEYPIPGACDDETGACSYAPSFDNCSLLGEQCIAGRCFPIDLCEGVTCEEPPPVFCDDRVVVSFADTGVCSGGGCEYEETRVDCAAAGQWCSDGACVDTDPCVDITCLPPGDPICSGSLSVLSSAGVCEAGECNYSPVIVDCAATGRECRDGVCVTPEPCTGGCNNPPAPSCESGRAIRYPATGTCLGDACVYAPTVEDCGAAGQVCAQGTCYDSDPCEDVVCSTPPPNACAGTRVVEYRPFGGCVEGACRYGADLGADCSTTGGTCLDGVCQPGPCTGVNCFAPSPVCVSDTVLRVFIDGTCTLPDGTCTYTDFLEDCTTLSPTARCFSGVCAEEDPCEGVVCETPRPPFCDGNTAIVFDPVGTCDGRSGDCRYSSRREDCATLGGFCTDGACTSVDPCLGVVCDDRPANSCGFNTREDYSASGTCAGGECSYVPEITDCRTLGQFCYLGECQDEDPCAGLGCEEAIDPACEGNVAVVFSRGFCNAGVCIRSEGRTDCDLTGATCVDGACEGGDPCIGVVCSTPPDPFCRGTDAVVSSNPATCEDGDCLYAETVTRCGDVGDVCSNGFCVDPANDIRSGELVITEVAPLPSASAWFELVNNRSTNMNLRGLTIRGQNGTNTFDVIGDLVLVPGEAAVFGASATAGGGPDVIWDEAFSLTAPLGALRLLAGPGTVDDLAWDSAWPFSSGTAMQLDADQYSASGNNSVANWCAATASYAPGLFGTPGAENLVCP